MNKQYRILHVDDEPDFAALAAEYIERESDHFETETAMSASEGLELLAEEEFDCIVSDYDMPGTNGIEFLERVRDESPDLPFILFTGKGTEEVASRAISAGVTDYLQKEGGAEQFTVLANRIENLVGRYRAEQELDATRRQYQKVTEQNLAGIYLIQDGEFVYVNPKLADIHGYDRKTIIGMSPLDLVAPEERDRVRKNLQRRLDGEVTDIQYETIGLTKDGERIDIELHGSQITYEGRKAVIGAELDITDRKEHERELQTFKRRFEATFNNPVSFMALLEPDGSIIDINDEALSLADTTLEAVEGVRFWERQWSSHPDSPQQELQSQIEKARHGESVRFGADHDAPDSERVTADGVIHPICTDDGDVTELLVAGRDITEWHE